MKIVEKETRIINGQEYDHEITCCEAAKRMLKQWKSLDDTIRSIFDRYNPQIHCYIQVLYENNFPLNYCPVCGDKYGEEKDGRTGTTANSSKDTKRRKTLSHKSK